MLLLPPACQGLTSWTAAVPALPTSISRVLAAQPVLATTIRRTSVFGRSQ
jgi:hypothetical protein